MTDDEISSLHRAAVEACRAWVKATDARTEQKSLPWVDEPSGAAARDAVADLSRALYDRSLDDVPDVLERQTVVSYIDHDSDPEPDCGETVAFLFRHGTAPSPSEQDAWLTAKWIESSGYMRLCSSDGEILMPRIGVQSYQCGVCGTTLPAGSLDGHTCDRE